MHSYQYFLYIPKYLVIDSKNTMSFALLHYHRLPFSFFCRSWNVSIKIYHKCSSSIFMIFSTHYDGGCLMNESIPVHSSVCHHPTPAPHKYKAWKTSIQLCSTCQFLGVNEVCPITSFCREPISFYCNVLIFLQFDTGKIMIHGMP